MRHNATGVLRTSSRRGADDVVLPEPGTFRRRAEDVQSGYRVRADTMAVAKLEMERRNIRWADARAWALGPDVAGRWSRSDCPERGLNPAVVEAYCAYLDATSTEGSGA